MPEEQSINQIKNNLESVLFISHKPLSIAELAKLVGADKKQVEEILNQLAEEYKSRAGGVEILKVEDKYQMATAGGSSEVVAKFVKSELTGELTRPSLETLTIIAYRGPISKAELELIRGVNCSLIIRNLLIRGLVEAKEDKAKGFIYYSITLDFLKYLGIGKMEELPDFEKLNRNNNLDKLLQGLGNSATGAGKEIDEITNKLEAANA